MKHNTKPKTLLLYRINLKMTYTGQNMFYCGSSVVIIIIFTYNNNNNKILLCRYGNLYFYVTTSSYSQWNVNTKEFNVLIAMILP